LRLAVARRRGLLLVAVVLAGGAPTQPLVTSLPDPPQAERRPKDVSLHGERRSDDWHWLRERDDPAVLAHLRAENAYSEAWFAPHAALRQSLYDEMLARIQEDDEDVPHRKGRWWYGTRTVKGQPYPIHVRRADSPDGAEQVLLDLNVLAAGKPFLQLGAAAVSPDGHLLAFSLDETGALDFTLQVKDLRTGALLPVRIEKTADVQWANDNRTLLYLTKDAARRTHRLWRHTLGGSVPDTLVWEERDARFWLALAKTRDERYLVLTSESKDTSEIRVIDAERPAARMRIVVPRRKGREASLDHRAGLFYLRVNDTGRNFRLVTVPERAPSLAGATELIAHRPDVMLEGVDLFAGHMVVAERERGVRRLRVWDLASAQSHHVAFDEEVYAAAGRDNAEFDSASFRFTYTSLVTPESVYDYDMAGRRLTLKKRKPVLGGYDPSRYAARQIQARAADGTRVPVSLVWRVDLRHEGKPQPLLLDGYGAYGIPNDVHFSSSRVSLLDRGVIVALAHVRGGGDLGRVWYDDGKLGRKMNSFTDFVACAEALVALGFTTPAQLVIEGGSAGGLLVGAAANLRPELFRAVVAEVPFLDVINTMLDESIPLTVTEFLEWGNPKKKAEYRWMRAYSPYDNLRATAYPAIYLRTSLNDSQVGYWEAVKYAAKLRTLETGDRPVLLTINLDAGHGGASGRYDALEERAQTLAFMLVEWGLAR
jgi:oligopeptidase B